MTDPNIYDANNREYYRPPYNDNAAFHRYLDEKTTREHQENSKRFSALEQSQAVMKNDIKWVKWVLVAGITILGLFHFLDPKFYWWIFQFP